MAPEIASNQFIIASIGGRVTEPAYPITAHDYASDAEELERLEESLSRGPRGALAVSAISVGLLMLAWLFIYFFVFLPRGTVG